MRKFALIVAAGLAIYWLTHAPSVPVLPTPPRPVLPKLPKLPDLKPKPKCPNCPKCGAVIEDVVSGPEHGGRAVACDLPTAEHQKNIAAKGLGCCVFRSLDHAARYQNVPALTHFPEWMVEAGKVGGGYPQKVDALIPEKAKAAGYDPPDYVQITTGDAAALETALHNGWMPCITYGYSPRYGSNIAHMVNCVYLDAQWACVLDNNFPGTYEWVDRAEFLRRWMLQQGGWAIFLRAPCPPPIPRNA